LRILLKFFVGIFVLGMGALITLDIALNMEPNNVVSWKRIDF
jgi:hypothetical protein